MGSSSTHTRTSLCGNRASWAGASPFYVWASVLAGKCGPGKEAPSAAQGSLALSSSACKCPTLPFLLQYHSCLWLVIL